jgi:hypothetical protein
VSDVGRLLSEEEVALYAVRQSMRVEGVERVEGGEGGEGAEELRLYV